MAHCCITLWVDLHSCHWALGTRLAASGAAFLVSWSTVHLGHLDTRHCWFLGAPCSWAPGQQAPGTRAQAPGNGTGHWKAIDCAGPWHCSHPAHDDCVMVAFNDRGSLSRGPAKHFCFTRSLLHALTQRAAVAMFMIRWHSTCNLPGPLPHLTFTIAMGCSR